MRVFILFFLLPALCSAQNRSLRATYTDTPLRIDGVLDEADWAKAEMATDFTELTPEPNTPSAQRTEVRILYNNQAIYIGATLYDSHPDSILRQLSIRDDIFASNADNFGVHIDAMLTRQSAFAFMVTAAGVQYDDDNDDPVWDAAWRSKVRTTAEGWTVEMEIPYSQLRFPPAENQVWGINFSRTIRRSRETAWWAPLDPSNDNYAQQFGTLEGISNIKPPLRLSLTPYVATYLRHFDDGNAATPDWTPAATAGADLKYGISENFTLDLSLIPDFGDTQSDDLEFNLSPFEIYYAERRPFFTEGIEIFNRGDLFYSRRVGSLPSRFGWAYSQLNANERLVKNAETTQLINAFKVSGRTAKGFGLGVFNAITAPAHADIEVLDTLGRVVDTRRLRTEPLANYNVLVLDQQFGDNSYLSFTQTSVLRFGEYSDAFAWGLDWRAVNKKNMYGFLGTASYSFIDNDPEISPNEANKQGFRYDITFRKMRGNFRFTAGNYATSANFDINDLGYSTATNIIGSHVNLNYSIFKPFGIYNNMRMQLSAYQEMLLQPNEFSRIEIAYNMWGTFRNFLSGGFDFAYQPLGYRDYFEARNNFQPWQKPQWGRVGAWLSSDYRKAFALDASFSYRRFAASDSTWAGSYVLEFAMSPRLRFSDKFYLILETNPIFRPNNIGFVRFLDITDEEGNVRSAPLFGSRYRQDFINTIEANYLFNDLMSLSLRLRHYWSYVVYSDFYELSSEGGHLSSAYAGMHDQRYNAFNIDLIYRWRFAPGSELNVVWKNAVLDFSSQVERDYARNFAAMYEENQRNSFSIKVLYFFDVGGYFASRRASRLRK